MPEVNVLHGTSTLQDKYEILKQLLACNVLPNCGFFLQSGPGFAVHLRNRHPLLFFDMRLTVCSENEQAGDLPTKSWYLVAW